jgi:hypothetical protein
MGMFDSLILEFEGQKLEVQSKRFASMMGEYRVGDWVEGAPPGIRVYFDRRDLDESGRTVYAPDAVVARSLTIFIVLAQGVFAAYRVVDSALPPETIKDELRSLRERWQDTARVQDLLVESVRAKQERIAYLDAQLQRVRSVLTHAARLKAEGSIDDRFPFIHEEVRRLAAGEDPLAVIDWLLDDETGQPGFWRCGPISDALDEFRL